MSVRNPTTIDGYPDFRLVEKPADSDFDIQVRDCGCMEYWCNGARWRASVVIGRERWSVTASTHCQYVMVHRDNLRKKKYHPIGPGADLKRALQESFWDELNRLGYDGGAAPMKKRGG